MPPPHSSSPPREAGLAAYLKHAFLYRWNLLLFLGSIGAAALSPWPDATLPLVLAGEVAYLGALLGHPRFRSAIDALLHQEEKGTRALETEQSLAAIIRTLPDESRRRFERLRNRCLEMRAIAHSIRGGNGTESGGSTSSIDRLLWVFLRLLASGAALDRLRGGGGHRSSHQRGGFLDEVGS